MESILVTGIRFVGKSSYPSRVVFDGCDLVTHPTDDINLISFCYKNKYYWFRRRGKRWKQITSYDTSASLSSSRINAATLDIR